MGKNNDLHITIGTVPQIGVPIEEFLSHDVQIVKAALLYSDRVTLCSPIAWLVTAITSFENFSSAQQIHLVEKLLPELIKNDSPQEAEVKKMIVGLYAKLDKVKATNPAEAQMKARLQSGFRALWDDIKRQANDLSRDLGAVQLQKSIKSGIVTVHNLGQQKNNLEVCTELLLRRAKETEVFDERMKEDALTKFLSFIKETTERGSTYPLFDKGTGDFVRVAIESGLFSPSRTQSDRAKHIGLALDLIERLPLFDLATVDEILDIRKELRKPLKKFQSAVMGYSQKIKSAAWDEEFPLEAEDVFRAEVDAVVSEIEDAIQSNKYLLRLWGTMTGSSALVPAGGSVLGMASTSLAHLPEIASTLAGIGVGSALMASGAYRSWREEAQKQEKHQLFFYYRAKQRLQEADQKRGVS